jgi:hypothetical protein
MSGKLAYRQKTDEQMRETSMSCDFYALVIDEENGNKLALLSCGTLHPKI